MSVLVRPLVHSAPGGATTGITLSLPSVLPDGTLIVVSVGSPNTITGPAGFTPLFAELVPGTYHFRMWYRFASGDAGGSYAWSWASTTNAELTAALLYDSSGSNLTLGTPVTSAIASGAATQSLPVVTPAQAGSAYLFGVAGANGSGGLASTTAVSLGSLTITGMGYYGIAGTTAPATQPTITANAVSDWSIGVVEIKSSVAGAAVLVGEGHTANSGAASSAAVSISPQTQNGDWMLALLAARNVGSPVTFTPPPDITIIANSGSRAGTAGADSLTLSASILPGDLILIVTFSSGSLPALSTGYTNITTDSSTFFARAQYKIAIAGDAGATVNCGGSVFSLAGYVAFRSISGGTLSIDGTPAFNVGGASTSVVANSIRTSADNEPVAVWGAQTTSGGNSLTVPASLTVLANKTFWNTASGYLYQSQAGATGNQTFTSNGSAVTKGIQIAIATSAAPSPWTLVPNTTVNDVTNKIQTAAYVAKWLTGLPTSWTFNVSPSAVFNMEVLTLGNLAASPITTATAMATAGASALATPPISPGTSDELTVQFFAGNSTIGAVLSNPYDQPPSSIIAANGSNQLSVSYGDVSLCDPQYASTGSHTAAGAAVALSLKAATAPTRSSANVRVNQFLVMGAVALATPFSTPPAGATGPANLSPFQLPTGTPFSSLIARVPSQSGGGGPPPVVIVDAPNSAFRLPSIADNFSRFISRIPSSQTGDGAGGNLRETQTTADVIVQGASNLRETQVSAEVVVQDSAILRMTQDTVDVTVRIAEHYRLTQITMDVLIREGPLPPPPPPPPVNPTTSTTPEPSTAIVYSLARQVFEPLQEFTATIRAAVIEESQTGTKWSDLTNPWSTYLAAWDSFPSRDQTGVFIGLDDGTQITWNDLPNPWSTYAQSWNSFPAGGNVDLFSDNSTTDAGAAIAYSLVPALVQENSRQNILLDSWDFILKISSFFELLTVEFDSLKQPLSKPVPITATAISLNDKSTFSTPKAYPGPGQAKYSRYIRVTMSGVSFTRAFAFGGATIFVQILERPSN